jgi:hypothetical protein
MATLDWQLDRMGEATLVELSVHSDRAQQVRIESRLRPVWPPRRQGVPAWGWDDSSFEGTVGGDEALVLGYATPAPPEEPPAEIVETGRPEQEVTVTPDTVVRALGDSRPPRDVLPKSDRDGTGADRTAQPEPTAGDRNADPVHADGGVGVVTDTGDVTPTQSAETANPEPVEPTAWFEAVESRIATTEQLAGATDADEIRTTVEEVGGIAAVRELQAQLDADRRQLRKIRRRSETLAEQLSAVELPLATLERVV